MRIMTAIATMFLLLATLVPAGAGAADTVEDVRILNAAPSGGFGGSLKDAERLYDSGRYDEAEALVKRLLQEKPESADLHILLGDVYKRTGRLEEALDEYGKARTYGGENAEILKKEGTVYKWLKRYSRSLESYERALSMRPDDREASEDLRNLKLSRGLRINLMFGGWEPDYTQTSYEAMAFYGGLDRLDIYGGFGYSDQIYYERTKYYAKAYYFYSPRDYVKLNPSYKDYDYPVDPALKAPNPDSNAYDKVPSLEAEVSHWFTDNVRLTLTYEFFRPSFFYDTDSHANNHKISGELYYLTPVDSVRLKLFLAILRDPDPDKTRIKGRTLNVPQGPAGSPPVKAASTDIQYQIEALLGAGVEYSKDRWDGYIKLLPNRDLDSSYSYSILAGVGYRSTDRIRGKLDFVHDKYSSNSTYSGKTANVYLISGFYRLSDRIDLGAGYKYLDLPTGKENTGFFTASLKTGFGF